MELSILSIIHFIFQCIADVDHHSLFILGNITTGLIGWWKFDEGTGTSATDFSGGGNTGTLTGGPTWVAGIVGPGALSFDRTNDYVDIPGTLTIPANTFTLSMWVNLNSAVLTDTLFGQSNTASSFAFRVNDNLSITALVTGASLAVTNNSIVLENTRQHIVYSRSGTGAGKHAIYLDGVSQALVTDSELNYVATTNAKQIGQRGDGLSFAGGVIDDVRIYNRALSASDVLELFYYPAQIPGLPLGGVG